MAAEGSEDYILTLPAGSMLLGDEHSRVQEMASLLASDDDIGVVAGARLNAARQWNNNCYRLQVADWMLKVRYNGGGVRAARGGVVLLPLVLPWL